jgi:hypothetical protein
MPLLLGVVARLPLDVPVAIDRVEAQRLARLELLKPEYTRADEPLVQKVIQWFIDRVGELLDTAGRTSPLGWFGILGVVLLVVLAIIAIRRRTGPLARRSSAPLFDGGVRDAEAHRRDAERLAGEGAYAEALRERLRALVRDLEERGLLDVRPGRTADEVARDAGAVLPSVSRDLAGAARLFDDVWFGGRVADRSSYDRMVAVDDAVRAAKPGQGAQGADAPMAVPR